MMRRMLHACSALVAALLMVLADPASAALTGKIAGRVVDRSTGEPIAGAAVVLVGARIGATTDADGFYFLLNVGPGDYDVQASLVGYRSETKRGLRVNVDRTASVGFELEPSAIEVEGVTVTAPREVIQLDVSGSKTIVEGRELTAVPVRNVEEALALEPAVDPRGQVRGGSLDQTQVIVDGHLLTDERYNYPVLNINATIVEEIQILSGGFNAEFGNARSGIVNVVSRAAAGQPIWSSVQGQYYPAHKKFFEPEQENPFDPVNGPKVTYSAYGENSLEWQIYGQEGSLTNSSVLKSIRGPGADSVWRTADDNVVTVATIPSWNAYALTQKDSGADAGKMYQMRWMHQHRIMDYAQDADYWVDGTVGIPLGRRFGIVVSGRKEFTAYAIPASKPGYGNMNIQARVNMRPIDPLRIDLTFVSGHEDGMAGGDAEEAITVQQIGGEAWGSRRGMLWQLVREYGRSVPLITWGKYNYVGGQSLMDLQRTMFGATVSYTINPQSFLNATLEYKSYEYAVRPQSDGAKYLADETPLYVPVAQGDPVNVLTAGVIGNLNTAAGLDTMFFGLNKKGPADKMPYGWSTGVDGGSDGTWFNYYLGGTSRPRDSSDWNAISFRGSYTNQINVRNQVKVGLEATSTQINQIGGYAHPNHIGMQAFTETPFSFAMYAQDKIEYEGMIANVGLRLDYFDSKGQSILGDYPYSPLLDDKAWGSQGWEYTTEFPNGYPTGDRDFGFDIGKILMRDWGPGGLKSGGVDSLHAVAASAKTAISPRIGVSHPIGPKTKVFFNYGHFYSQPLTRHLYGISINSPQAITWQGNPDLEMQRTIAYELGFDQELFQQYLLHVAGYYKDATNQMQIVAYYAKHGLHVYYRPFNKAYADIRGFEFKAAKVEGRFITGFLTGGVNITKNTSIGYAAVYQDPNSPPIRELNQPTSRPTPFATLSLDLHTPTAYSAFGLPAIATGGWSLSWLTEYQRGGQFVYDPSNILYIKRPNAETQDTWLTNLRLSKGFSFGKLNLTAFLDVFNLFNRKFWNGSMAGDESTDYLKSLHFPIDNKSIETDKGTDKLGDTPEYAIMPIRNQWALYAYPRSIAFGVKMDF